MNSKYNLSAARALLNAAVAASALVLAGPSTWAAPADDIRLINTTPSWVTSPAGWNTSPVATAKPGLPFVVLNQTDPQVAQFAAWAATPSRAPVGSELEPDPVLVIRGDFNGDGLTDIALLSRDIYAQPPWQTMPVAYANADGSFTVANPSIGQFATWATDRSTEVVTGDFNGDGRTDVALIRHGPGWTTAPVLLSQANGSFVVANWDLGQFAGWAASGGPWGSGADQMQTIAGDFNGDGLTDLALVRSCGYWASIPVAYAQPQGGFRVENHPASSFAQNCSNDPNGNSKAVVGDFNGDGKTDLARFSAGTMIVARATGTGFTVSTPNVGLFAQRAQQYPVTVLTGKFDAGPTTDIALVNQAGGQTDIAIAFGGANGQFTVKNIYSPYFANLASTGAQPFVGDFDGNGLADIALVPRGNTASMNWTTIPIAYSYTYTVPGEPRVCEVLIGRVICTPATPSHSEPGLRFENQQTGSFADWAKLESVKIVVGEFIR